MLTATRWPKRLEKLFFWRSSWFLTFCTFKSLAYHLGRWHRLEFGERASYHAARWSTSWECASAMPWCRCCRSLTSCYPRRPRKSRAYPRRDTSAKSPIDQWRGVSTSSDLGWRRWHGPWLDLGVWSLSIRRRRKRDFGWAPVVARIDCSWLSSWSQWWLNWRSHETGAWLIRREWRWDR
jgi:hypothetical protein